jgi:hypothetical protein
MKLMEVDFSAQITTQTAEYSSVDIPVGGEDKNAFIFVISLPQQFIFFVSCTAC